MREMCRCGNQYTLGVDGTVDGCDECERIYRNLVGQIVFGLEAEDESDVIDNDAGVSGVRERGDACRG